MSGLRRTMLALAVGALTGLAGFGLVVLALSSRDSGSYFVIDVAILRLTALGCVGGAVLVVGLILVIRRRSVE